MKREPALIIGAIMVLVDALIGLGVVFGFDLAADQKTAIIGATSAILTLAGAVWTRASVYAPATVAARAAVQALRTDLTGTPTVVAVDVDSIDPDEDDRTL